MEERQIQFYNQKLLEHNINIQNMNEQTPILKNNNNEFDDQNFQPLSTNTQSSLKIKNGNELDHEINHYRQRLSSLDRQNQSQQQDSIINDSRQQNNISHNNNLVNMSMNSDFSRQQQQQPSEVMSRIQRMEESYKSRMKILEDRIQHLENDNTQLRENLNSEKQENFTLRQTINNQKQEQKKDIEQALKDQAKKFIQQNNLSIQSLSFQNEKQKQEKLNYHKQLDELKNEKSILLDELQNIKTQHESTEEEKENISQSYNNLLNLHNQLLEMDIQKNRHNLENSVLKPNPNNNKNQQQSQHFSSYNSQQITQHSEDKNQYIDWPSEIEKYKQEFDNYKNFSQNQQHALSQELQKIQSELREQKKLNEALNGELMNVKFTEQSQNMNMNIQQQQQLKQQQQLQSQYQQNTFETGFSSRKNLHSVSQQYVLESNKSDNIIEPTQTSQGESQAIFDEINKQIENLSLNLNYQQQPLNNLNSKPQQQQQTSQVIAQTPKSSKISTQNSEYRQQRQNNNSKIEYLDGEVKKMKKIVNEKIVNRQNSKKPPLLHNSDKKSKNKSNKDLTGNSQKYSKKRSQSFSKKPFL